MSKNPITDGSDDDQLTRKRKIKRASIIGGAIGVTVVLVNSVFGVSDGIIGKFQEKKMLSTQVEFAQTIDTSLCKKFGWSMQEKLEVFDEDDLLIDLEPTVIAPYCKIQYGKKESVMMGANLALTEGKWELNGTREPESALYFIYHMDVGERDTPDMKEWESQMKAEFQ